MKARSILAFVLLGFSATIGQILVLRELLTIFSGSELSVAIVLAAWLFWTAIGSLSGGRISQRLLHPQTLFIWLQTLSGLFLLATIFFIRAARPLWGIGAGELVNLLQLHVISFLALAPFCFVSGILFPLACSVLAQQVSGWTRSPGLVYFLEGLGAGVGGLLFTFLLIQYFNGVQIAGGIAFLLCLSGLALTVQMNRKSGPRICLHVFILMSLVLVQYQSNRLEKTSRMWNWSGFQLLDSRETIFGHIVVVAKGNQLSFFESGLWNFSVPDRLSSEEAVHYGLLQHPEPRNVLLIGGGISGSLAQILQHPSIQRVEYVELDPELIRLGKVYLPQDLTAALQDPRVVVSHEDGRQVLAQSSGLFDVILLNLPEPFNAQLNRFYTREFFRLAAGKMRDGGVFSFTASGAETALGPVQAKYLRLLYQTASSVFPTVVVFPGQSARFFCSNSSTGVVRQPEILVERLEERHLELLYVQDHYMLWDLSLLRQESFMARLDQADETRVNSDLTPLAYSYNLLLWGTQYSTAMAKWVVGLSKRTVWCGVGILLLLVTVLLYLFRSKKDPFPKVRLLYAVAIFGFTEISLEILMVFSFQVFFGYVYYKIGLLLALFMVGLALGSLTLSYYPKRKSAQIKALMGFQLALGCFCLGLAAVILFFYARPGLSHHHFLYREAFPLLSLAAGFLGGTHFPLANRLLLQEQPGLGLTAGLVYGVDLLGSFVGCLLVGLVFIPSVGILQTLFILALVNITAVVPLLRRAQSA